MMKKKILLTLLCALCLTGLASCRKRPAAPLIVMETQYYDEKENYIEIPALVLSDGGTNEALDAINTALDGLRTKYSGILDDFKPSWEEQCLFYPSTTDRYLNLLFYQSRFVTDLNSGHVFSLVYDMEEEAQVSAEDALALAGLDEAALLEQVTQLACAELDREGQEYGYDFPLTLYNLTLEGFRVNSKGQPLFYLTAWVDDVDEQEDYVSGAEHLYIWEDGDISIYEQYSLGPAHLVPEEETDKLDPPLWSQWRFSGDGTPPSVSSQPQGWTPAGLRNSIAPECRIEPYEFLTEKEAALLQDLPAGQLPKKAVDLSYVCREEFWKDILLPVAADEEYDVTVYFVFGNMPPRTYYGLGLMLWGGENLKQDGIVLRYGDRTAYFPLHWEINAKFGKNPPLLVDDLDNDGLPEAALSLTWGEGTGCLAEALYIFDLDTMTCTTPDYSYIPLDIALSPDETTVRLTSGALSELVSLNWLGDRFIGEAEVGNYIDFPVRGGRVLCRVDLDYSCDTLGYLSTAVFPVVYENGEYHLGPALVLTDYDSARILLSDS